MKGLADVTAGEADEVVGLVLALSPAVLIIVALLVAAGVVLGFARHAGRLLESQWD